MRVDVPTMQCDRCAYITQDINEMSKFLTLTGAYDGYQGTKQRWDLCTKCWCAFGKFVGAEQ